MEKETEQYLIKRIKELEQENAVLKGKAKDYENSEKVGKEIIRKRVETPTPSQLDEALSKNYFSNFKGLDLNIMHNKAKAFDELQRWLLISTSCNVEKEEYLLMIFYQYKGEKHRAEFPLNEEMYWAFQKAILTMNVEAETK